MSTDFRAEDIVYTSTTGVVRTVRVLIHGDTDRNDESMTREELERLNCRCSRVPAGDDATNDVGYIDNPIIGDKILRAVEKDPRQVNYVFTGRIEHEQPDRWVLIFERARVTVQGATRA